MAAMVRCGPICKLSASHRCRVGDLRGAYVLRTLTTADFGYESARDRLLGLKIQSRGEQTMLFASVADDPRDPSVDDVQGQRGSIQGSLMRLGTILNLESRLTVSYQQYIRLL